MFAMPTRASPGRRAARHRPASLLPVATAVAFACTLAPRGLAQDARPPDPQATPAAALAADVLPLWRCLFTREPFALRGRLTLRSNAADDISIRFARFDDECFDLEVTHEKYAAVIRRRADATALALPRHRIFHFGRGDVDADDNLAPRDSFARLVSAATAAAVVLPFLAQESPAGAAAIATGVLGVRHDPATGRWRRGDGAWLEGGAEGRFTLAVGKARLTLGCQHSHGRNRRPSSKLSRFW